MAKLNTRATYMYDAAPAVSLFDKGSAAVTSFEAGTPLLLERALGYWNTPLLLLADSAFAVVVNVDELEPTRQTTSVTFRFLTPEEGDAFTVTTALGSITLTAGTDFETDDDYVSLIAALDDSGLFELVEEDSDEGAFMVALGAIEFTDAADNFLILQNGQYDEENVYEIALEAANGDYSAFLTVDRLHPVSTGQHVMLVDVDTLKQMLPGVEQISLIINASGATSSIRLHGWLAGSIIR